MPRSLSSQREGRLLHDLRGHVAHVHCFIRRTFIAVTLILYNGTGHVTTVRHIHVTLTLHSHALATHFTAHDRKRDLQTDCPSVHAAAMASEAEMAAAKAAEIAEVASMSPSPQAKYHAAHGTS